MQRASARRAFTLIEVVAALALVGFVLIGAHAITVQVADARGRIHAASLADAAFRNGHRVLRSLFLNATPTADSARRFSGDSLGASFPSWCATASGWNEACQIRIVVRRTADSSTVMLEGSGDESWPLWSAAGAATLRYVDVSGATRRDWRTTDLPRAAILVHDADMLYLPVEAARD